MKTWTRPASIRVRLFGLLTIQGAWLLGLLVLALREEEDFPYVVGLSVCLFASLGLAVLIGRSRDRP